MNTLNTLSNILSSIVPNETVKEADKRLSKAKRIVSAKKRYLDGKHEVKGRELASLNTRLDAEIASREASEAK